MKGFYDRGHYDLDTYDQGVVAPRSATDLKLTMASVELDLDYMATAPTVSTDYDIEALQALRDDGTLSTAIQEPDGGVRVWGMRYGRHMSQDVVVSADALLQDLRSAPNVKDTKFWRLLKRHIHSGWTSFYNSSQTD